MKRVLVIGYGNVDREDDGIGWHVLETLSDHFGSPVMALDGGAFEHNHNPQLVFVLQLTPEMAESCAEYDFVCFVDAHTGAYGEEMRIAPIQAGVSSLPVYPPPYPGKLFGAGPKTIRPRPDRADGLGPGLRIWLPGRPVGADYPLMQIAVDQINQRLEQIDDKCHL